MAVLFLFHYSFLSKIVLSAWNIILGDFVTMNTSDLKKTLLQTLRFVKDFPKPGIQFVWVLITISLYF